MRSACVLCFALAGAQGGALGAITAVTGDARLIGPPASATQSSFASGQFVWCWNEQQSVRVSGLPVDVLGPAGTINSATPGTLSGVVNAHMLHHHFNFSWPLTPKRGTVTFDGPILGVIFETRTLNATDGVVGSLTTRYAPWELTRGALSPFQWFSFSGPTLTFEFQVSNGGFQDYAQVRVITAPVPAPGAGSGLVVGCVIGARRRRR